MTGVGVLAPWRGTENLGDYVIEASIAKKLAELEIAYFEIPTHSRPQSADLNRARRAELLLLAGTNALSGRLERTRQWWVTPDLVRTYRGRVVCMGVGWRTYEAQMTKYSRWALRSMLHPDAVHSVRDGYTREKLTSLGFKAINTSCPTMWDLDAVDRVEFNPETAIVTITNYRADSSRDRAWLQLVRTRFDRVLIQPMSTLDEHDAEQLADEFKLVLLPPSLRNFDRVLREFRPVYIGTRLHAGIRAFQMGLPGVLLAIDNRAAEIAKVSTLPVVQPDDIDSLTDMLDTQMGASWVRPAPNTGKEVREFSAALTAIGHV